ncbi:MAG TPA: metalloregulator ArsR/SmtB family transcription factor [Candidatus Binatia bacterium]|nr:metalloregulator ArsR/SmtB family transcription factor [Candidatus Binatia bacterium]
MKSPSPSLQRIELAAEWFRLLADPNRLRILHFLEPGRRTVGEIVAALRTSQPNVSKHLQALRQAGLVRRQRSGNFIYYSIGDPVVFRLCELACHSALAAARGRYGTLVAARGR